MPMINILMTDMFANLVQLQKTSVYQQYHKSSVFLI